MKRPNYLNQIRNIITKSKNGSVFVSTDFTDITDKKTVNMALLRLADEGLVKKILFGVYYKPEYSELLGETVAPSPNKVAHALARNFGWTIVPCGDTALNLLGLSTQVPSQWVYVSDGAYKEYTFDNTTIKFKRTTNKEISKVSYKTALTIQALKALGKENITEQVISRLKKILTDKEKEKIILFYVGDVESGALITQLKKKLPRYMIPNHVYALEQMPLTANGKIDRNKLKQISEEKKRRK